MEAPPEHARHDDAHATQEASSPLPLTETYTYVALGHSATQLPEERKGVAAEVHARHSEADGPAHVPHAASHGEHVGEAPLASLYLPRGVQSA